MQRNLRQRRRHIYSALGETRASFFGDPPSPARPASLGAETGIQFGDAGVERIAKRSELRSRPCSRDPSLIVTFGSNYKARFLRRKSSLITGLCRVARVRSSTSPRKLEGLWKSGYQFIAVGGGRSAGTG